MSILRSNTEMALDEVTEACREAADHYRSVRAAAHDPDLAAVFVALEEQRRRFSSALEEETRRLGTLPSAPDPDREAFEHLIVRLRATLAVDQRLPLLDSCLKMEERLGQALRPALALPLADRLADLLRQLERSVERARESLTQLAD